jgi:hypothetical protein
MDLPSVDFGTAHLLFKGYFTANHIEPFFSNYERQTGYMSGKL